MKSYHQEDGVTSMLTRFVEDITPGAASKASNYGLTPIVPGAN